jgi:putative ABC transport system permease protein
MGFLLGLLATLALALSVLGVYGVAAFTAVQRRREIGIRLALGARARSVVGLFVRRSLRLAAIGVIIGALGGFAGSRALASRLGVPASSALLLVAVGSLLALVTVAASYVPSWRAARVDPLITLRGD